MASKQATKRAGSSPTKRSNRSQALANRSRDREPEAAKAGSPVTAAAAPRRSRPNDPSRSNESAATPGTLRGAQTRLTAWDKGHRAREKANIHLVRATSYGYYANKLWKDGEEFYMGVDPLLEPPRWVVPIAAPGGEVLGVFESTKEGPKGKEKITGMRIVDADALPEDEELADDPDDAADDEGDDEDDGDRI